MVAKDVDASVSKQLHSSVSLKIGYIFYIIFKFFFNNCEIALLHRAWRQPLGIIERSCCFHARHAPALPLSTESSEAPPPRRHPCIFIRHRIAPLIGRVQCLLSPPHSPSDAPFHGCLYTSHSDDVEDGSMSARGGS